MNTLNITDVKVMPLKNGNYDCVAIAQFTVDNALAITGLKLYKKVNDSGIKFYVVFPKNIKNKKQMKYAHPLSDEVYCDIVDKIVAEYEKVKDVQNSQEMSNDHGAENEYYKKTFGATLNEDMDNIIKTIEDNDKIKSEYDKNMKDIEDMIQNASNDAAMENSLMKSCISLVKKQASERKIELPSYFNDLDGYQAVKWLKMAIKNPDVSKDDVLGMPESVKEDIGKALEQKQVETKDEEEKA